jgi:ABC-type glycerol-3-phosphate transport system permease component
MTSGRMYARSRTDPARPPDKPPALLQRASVRERAWKGLMLIILLALSAVFLFPILWALSASVKTLDAVYHFPPSLWVSDPQFYNYVRATERLPFLAFILNTLIICTAAVTGQVLSASMVGYAFARLRWKGRDVWFILLLATMMLPQQVLLIPHYLQFKYLGWVNTYKPLIVPEWLGGAAFYIFLFRQFFKGIPREMEEAARIDGAGDWQIFWSIFLPNAKPALATVGVLAFIGHWKEFMRPLIYLSDFTRYPISLGLQMYQAQEGSWINYLMAASVVALAPLVILFFLAQRYFVKGLLLTGSKG